MKTLTVKQVMDRKGVTRPMIHFLLRNGKLTGEKVDGIWMVDNNALLEAYHPMTMEDRMKKCLISRWGIGRKSDIQLYFDDYSTIKERNETI